MQQQQQQQHQQQQQQQQQRQQHYDNPSPRPANQPPPPQLTSAPPRATGPVEFNIDLGGDDEEVPLPVVHAQQLKSASGGGSGAKAVAASGGGGGAKAPAAASYMSGLDIVAPPKSNKVCSHSTPAAPAPLPPLSPHHP